MNLDPEKVAKMSQDKSDETTKSNSQEESSKNKSKETVQKSQQPKSSGQALPNQPPNVNLRKGRGRPRKNKNSSQPSQKESSREIDFKRFTISNRVEPGYSYHIKSHSNNKIVLTKNKDGNDNQKSNFPELSKVRAILPIQPEIRKINNRNQPSLSLN